VFFGVINISFILIKAILLCITTSFLLISNSPDKVGIVEFIFFISILELSILKYAFFKSPFIFIEYIDRLFKGMFIKGLMFLFLYCIYL